MAFKKDYEGKYFIFGINSPHARRIYGEETTNDSCIIFQKRYILIPIGDEAIKWMNLDTDNPPRRENSIKLLKKLRVEEVFTTSLIYYPETTLWGLWNIYAPKDWDYKKDSVPPAEIYFSIEGEYLDERNQLIKIDDIGLKAAKKIKQ